METCQQHAKNSSWAEIFPLSQNFLPDRKNIEMFNSTSKFQLWVLSIWFLDFEGRISCAWSKKFNFCSHEEISIDWENLNEWIGNPAKTDQIKRLSWSNNSSLKLKITYQLLKQHEGLMSSYILLLDNRKNERIHVECMHIDRFNIFRNTRWSPWFNTSPRLPLRLIFSKYSSINAISKWHFGYHCVNQLLLISFSKQESSKKIRHHQWVSFSIPSRWNIISIYWRIVWTNLLNFQSNSLIDHLSNQQSTITAIQIKQLLSIKDFSDQIWNIFKHQLWCWSQIPW